MNISKGLYFGNYFRTPDNSVLRYSGTYTRDLETFTIFVNMEEGRAISYKPKDIEEFELIGVTGEFMEIITKLSEKTGTILSESSPSKLLATLVELDLLKF